MVRKLTGFGVKGIGGDRPNNRFKAKRGVQSICKPIFPFGSYRSHKIEHPTKRRPTGEPVGFSMTCAKEWTPEDPNDPDNGAGAWEGECLACDQGHIVEDRYAMGWLILAEKHERTGWQHVAPEHCVSILDFPDGKCRDFRRLNAQEEMAGGDLSNVEIIVELDNKPDAEQFQKWVPTVSKGASYLTQEHLDAWAARGEAMLDEHVRAPSIDEQRRRLKFDDSPVSAPAPQYRPAPQAVADDPALSTLPVVPARTPVARAPLAAKPAPAAPVKAAAVVAQPRAVAPKAAAPAAAPKAPAPVAAKPVAKAPVKAAPKPVAAPPPPPADDDDQAALNELVAEAAGTAGAETAEGEPVF